MDDIRHTIRRSSARFMDQLRLHMRKSGLAYRTEQTYVHWIKRYIHFHKKQHPKNLVCRDIEKFMGHLSINLNFSPNTQRVALNALVYLYARFLGLDVGKLDFTLARPQRRLPVVYSRDEVAAILKQLRGEV